MWHQLKNVTRLKPAEISADVEIGPESPWFSGHFPDDPIVPGVAQLGMVLEALRHFSEKNMAITEISRIRFRRIIRPNEPIKILAAPAAGKGGTYTFRIMVGEEMVCNGFMGVREA